MVIGSSSNGQNAGNADNGHFRRSFIVLGSKMALIIHDNRKYAKRAFYCMMNTAFWVGIMIPARNLKN